MKEIEDIIKAFDQAQHQGKQTALATVVKVEGSSYRRAGARMLVTEDGQLTGAISGGCLEGDALRKARLVMAQQQPMLVTYDTTDDDDAKLGVDLGCNGIIHILIEPVHAAEPANPIALFKKVLSKRRNAVLVTLFSLANRKGAQPGTCLLLTADEEVMKCSDAGLQEQLRTDAAQVLQTGRSAIRNYVSGENELTGFVELVKPPVNLLVFGGGNDAIPLVQMAVVLGWHTTVVDGRTNYASAERFPVAKKVLLAKPEQALASLQFDSRTLVVLMTHNYNYDLAMLRGLLPLELTYVGSLGPKKKLNRMLDELKEEGIVPTEKQLKSIYGPTGLDIGAETSEEIALSMLSEMQAVLQGRAGTSLREKETLIHTPMAEITGVE